MKSSTDLFSRLTRLYQLNCRFTGCAIFFSRSKNVTSDLLWRGYFFVSIALMVCNDGIIDYNWEESLYAICCSWLDFFI